MEALLAASAVQLTWRGKRISNGNYFLPSLPLYFLKKGQRANGQIDIPINWAVANCQWPNHSSWQNFQDKETKKAKHSRAIHATCCQLKER
jgi:hypothetical protein